MKKLIYSAIAAIGLLLSPACSDENEVLSSSENEALVSFNVNLADGISTKAGNDSYTIGKGQKVNKLHVLVYESTDNAADGEVAGHISSLDQTKDITVGTPINVSFSLVKGKTYHFLFWAQYEKKNEEENWTSPYTFGEDGTVSIKYGSLPLSNDERYDAFVATETRTIETDISFKVELTRPFAQLNFLTTEDDIKKAVAGRIIPGSDFSEESLNSIVTIDNVATKLNPFTKKVFDPEEVTFKANATPFTITHESGAYTEDKFTVAATGTGNTVSITPNTYYYLATNYFLVNTGEGSDASTNTTLTSAKLEIANSDYRALVIPNIPVKQNYRTNIYGDLLTANGTFDVTIDPIIKDDPENNNVESTPDAITTAINKGKRVFNLEVTNEDNTIYVPKVFATENDETLTFNVTNSAATSGAKIVYKETPFGTGTSAPKKVIIKSSGNWDIDLPASMVTLFGTGDNNSMGDITVHGETARILLPVGYTFGNVSMSSGKIWNYAGATINGNPTKTINGTYYVGNTGGPSNTPLSKSPFDVVSPSATISTAISGGYRHLTLIQDDNTNEDNTLDDYYYIDLKDYNINSKTLKLTGSNQITFTNSASSSGNTSTVTIDISKFNGKLIIEEGVTATAPDGSPVTSN